MLSVLKQVTTPIILTSFLAAVFFGFFAMPYGPDGRMEGGCPFSAAGASLCPQDALPAVLHHVSSYQSFTNVPINSVTALMSVLLFAAYVFMFALRTPLLEPLPQNKNAWRAPPLSSRAQKIIRWLALLEHSPSYR